MAALGELAPGAVLAGFRVEGLLGSGGMGVVYKATQLSLGRFVALKVLAPELASDAEVRRRFIQEGRLAAKVDHPNLVRVLEVAEHEGQLLLAFELVVGETLRSRLDRAGRLTADEAVEVARACSAVLESLHASGVLHRDLKPANIFSSSQRGVLIGDLGIAKDLVDGALKTQQGVLLGTPAYMAPELCSGRPASRASDIYSLGVVFFECLAGHPPFEAEDPYTVLRMHQSAPVPRLQDSTGVAMPEHERVIRRSLAKLPEERFPDASSLSRALEQLPKGVERRPQTAAPDPTLSGKRPVAPRVQKTVVSRSAAVAKVPPNRAVAPLEAQAGRGRSLAIFCAILAAAWVPAWLLWPRAPEAQPVQAKPADAPVRIASAPPLQSATETADAAFWARDNEHPLRELEEAPARTMVLHCAHDLEDALRWPGMGQAAMALRSSLARVQALANSRAANDPAGRTLHAAGKFVEALALGFGECEKALGPQLELVRRGVPGAARRAGRMLISLFLAADFARMQYRFVLKSRANSPTNAGDIREMAIVRPREERFIQEVSRWSARLGSRLPAAVPESRDACWRAGVASLEYMRLLGRPDADWPAARAALAEVCTSTLRELASKPRAGWAEFHTVRGVLRLQRKVRAYLESLALVTALGKELRGRQAPPPADPSLELLDYELSSEESLLRMWSLAGQPERQTMSAELAALRGRLAGRWALPPGRPNVDRLSPWIPLAMALEDAFEQRLNEIQNTIGTGGGAPAGRSTPETSQ